LPKEDINRIKYIPLPPESHPDANRLKASEIEQKIGVNIKFNTPTTIEKIMKEEGIYNLFSREEKHKVINRLIEDTKPKIEEYLKSTKETNHRFVAQTPRNFTTLLINIFEEKLKSKG
jgi:hypothetical protein